MSLQDKTAIVTGGATGIGRACAERLVAEGVQVLIADIADEAGEAAAAELRGEVEGVEPGDRDLGGKASFFHCDVSERLDVLNLMARAADLFGHIDILVNNAGIIDDAPFLELDVDDFDRVLGVNLRGAFLVAQAVAKTMVAGLEEGREPGTIVNMSSINAHFALPDHVAYTISKGGIQQLTRAMAVALAPHGIRVNAVAPGSINTPMLETVAHDEALMKTVLSRTPMGRLGRPSEIAALVAFLAGPDASYVTGATLVADGGRMPLAYMMPEAED